MINVCELVSEDEAIPFDHRDRIRSTLIQSRACLETIVRLYCLRHGYGYANTYLTHHLTVLAFMSIAQLKSMTPTTSPADAASAPSIKDARSAMFLAAKGLHDQAKNYYTSLAVS